MATAYVLHTSGVRTNRAKSTGKKTWGQQISVFLDFFFTPGIRGGDLFFQVIVAAVAFCFSAQVWLRGSLL